jgi:hypothetical protein
MEARISPVSSRSIFHSTNGTKIQEDHWKSKMNKFLTIVGLLTVVATPAFAQSFDPDTGTGNVLTFAYTPTAPKNERTAIGQSGLHSFAMVPRVPAVGPGQNFPYPDRPYGDPDHW